MTSSTTNRKLHPHIKADLERMNRKPVEVIDPSPGLWGGEPVPGLVTVVYACDGFEGCPQGCTPHTHHALYGPTAEAGSEGMELYAD